MRGLSWPPSSPLTPGDALEASRVDARRLLKSPPLAVSHHSLLTPPLAVARVGVQALLEANLRLATTEYLSNGYDSLQPDVTLPILLSNTFIFLSACEVRYSTTYCFFVCNRVW